MILYSIIIWLRKEKSGSELEEEKLCGLSNFTNEKTEFQRAETDLRPYN